MTHEGQAFHHVIGDLFDQELRRIDMLALPEYRAQDTGFAPLLGEDLRDLRSVHDPRPAALASGVQGVRLTSP